MSEIYKEAYLNQNSRWDHLIKNLQQRLTQDNLNCDQERELRFVLELMDSAHRGLGYCPREEKIGNGR